MPPSSRHSTHCAMLDSSSSSAVRRIRSSKSSQPWVAFSMASRRVNSWAKRCSASVFSATARPSDRGRASATITAQLTDLGAEPVEIGMPVEMVTRRLRSDGDERGMLVYGYKFRPVMQR